MVPYRLNASKHSEFVSVAAKGVLHLSANGVPLFLWDPRMNPTVGNDFDAAVGQQQVNQDTVVVFGIPYV